MHICTQHFPQKSIGATPPSAINSTTDFPVASRMKSQESANRTTSTDSTPSSNLLTPATGNTTLKSAEKMPPTPLKPKNLTEPQSLTANQTIRRTTPARTTTPAQIITTPGPPQTTLDDHLPVPPALPTATNPTSPPNSERMAS